MKWWYRFHEDPSTFSRKNAFSFGGDYTDDDGNPLPALRGYSAFASGAELISYIDGNGWEVPDTMPVAYFQGEQHGEGYDNEPLVMPSGKVAWSTLAQLRADPEHMEES